MSTAGKSNEAWKGKSYEDWKESLEKAEAAGELDWSEEWSEAGGPILKRQGAMEGNGLGPLLASLGLLLVSAIVLAPKFRHLTVGERTVGIVVGYKNYGYGVGSTTIRVPIVRYSAPGGVYDTLGFLPAARSTYPEGKEVSVLFLRNEPRNAVIADFVQLFMIPTVVGGVGLVLLTGTSVFMYWTVRGELPTNIMSVLTRRQFAVADAANKDATNKDAANNNDANIDDPENPNPQRERHTVAQG
jgi:hypothetical protein